MAEIALSNGMIALVDDRDLGFLSRWNWHAKPAGRKKQKWYAVRNQWRDGKQFVLSMHKVLCDVAETNLRPATRAQNCYNRRDVAPNRFGFRGVKANFGTFSAQIRAGGRRYLKCGFPTPEDAAKAYDAMATELPGEFAVLNFPQSMELCR